MDVEVLCNNLIPITPNTSSRGLNGVTSPYQSLTEVRIDKTFDAIDGVVGIVNGNSNGVNGLLEVGTCHYMKITVPEKNTGEIKTEIGEVKEDVGKLTEDNEGFKEKIEELRKLVNQLKKRRDSHSQIGQTATNVRSYSKKMIPMVIMMSDDLTVRIHFCTIFQ